MIATHDTETDDAAVKLGGVGFSDREISGLIGVTEGYVRRARFRAKSKKRRKRKA